MVLVLTAWVLLQVWLLASPLLPWAALVPVLVQVVVAVVLMQLASER